MKKNSVTSLQFLMGKCEVRLRKCCFSSTVLILTLCILHLLSSSTIAQTTTSTIQGTVTDANNAVVAGAEVKISGTTLASERNATANADGYYRLTALPAGT